MVRLPTIVNISSTHSVVKHIAKLNNLAKYRNSQRSLLLFGENVVREALFDDTLVKKTLILPSGPGCSGMDPLLIPPDSARRKYSQIALPPTYSIPAKTLSSVLCLSSPTTHPVLEITFPATWNTPPSLSIKRPPRLLILDSIRDPGNIGTLIRSCTAFDWDGICVIGNCVDMGNGKVIRSSKGSAVKTHWWKGDNQTNRTHSQQVKLNGLLDYLESIEERLSIHTTNGFSNRFTILLADPPRPVSSTHAHRSVHPLGFHIYSPSQHALTTDFSKTPLALVLTSEMGPNTDTCHSLLKTDFIRQRLNRIVIPMNSNKIESLNVGVAGSLLLWGLRR
ncbi:hypothetical protein BKA69DRAFT_1128941 [Paraphysoderma sedebokerense]|nr:hypothetical protein BKA69DRAFT_1128941 [Paraphysoderma sedebokerense]